MTSAGSATAVWVSAGTLFVASHPAGGPWSEPAALGPAAEEIISYDVAVAPGGASVIGWSEQGTESVSVYASLSANGRDFDPPQLLASGLETAGNVAVDRDGSLRAYMGWTQRSGGTNQLMATSFSGINPNWDAPTELKDTSNELSAFDLDLNRFGIPRIAWAETDAGTATVLTVEGTIEGTYSMGGAKTVSSGSPSYAGELTVSSADATAPVVVWNEFNGATEVMASVGPAFSSAATISSPDEDINGVVFADSEKGGLVAWSSSPLSGPPAVKAAVRASNGEFAAPVTVSGADDAWEPAAAVGPAGDGVVAWQEGGMSNQRRIVAKALTAGAFSGPTALSEPGRNSGGDVATTASGSAVAVWRDDPDVSTSVTRGAGGKPELIKARGYEVSPPVIRDVAVSEAKAGLPFTLSVDAIATWSKPEVEIEFDDGTKVKGSTATHTYCAVGDHKVTVSASNGVGSSAEERTVKVVPGPGCFKGAFVSPKQVKIKKGRVTLKFKNEGTVAVQGQVRLWTTAKLTKGTKGPSQVGLAPLAVGPGKTVTVTVKLSGKALKRINRKKNKKLAVKATALLSEAGGNQYRVVRKVLLKKG